MKNIIKDLYKLNRTLLGEGIDNAFEYLKHLIDLDILEFETGTKLETWEVPPEWVVRGATIKHKGKTIVDYKDNPLSLTVYSRPFKGKITGKELKKHLSFVIPESLELSTCKDCNDLKCEVIEETCPYTYRFYDNYWGFGVPKHIFDSISDKKKYDIEIDTELRKGTMKVGVHTIKGKTDKEILLLAHLDHPYQANDNLSGVACLVDIAKHLKGFEHTIKLIFCPETIGSIAYALTQDLSKVDYAIAVDAIGGDNTLLFQKSFNGEDSINKIVHIAIQNLGISYRKGNFRHIVGSDEYAFCDPKIGIPAIMLSRIPYPEYHTSQDAPNIIKEDKLEEVQKAILKIIEISEKDYIPVRKFKAPLMRSRYGFHTPHKTLNLSYDYMFYLMDGKKRLSELCCNFALDFDHTYKHLKQMEKDGYIGRTSGSKKAQQ